MVRCVTHCCTLRVSSCVTSCESTFVCLCVTACGFIAAATVHRHGAPPMENMAALIRTCEGLQTVVLAGNGIGSLGMSALLWLRLPPRADSTACVVCRSSGVSHVAKALALSAISLVTLHLNSTLCVHPGLWCSLHSLTHCIRGALRCTLSKPKTT